MVILANFGYKQSQVYNINCKVAPLLELIRRTSHHEICKLLQTKEEEILKEIADIMTKVETKEKKLSKLENPIILFIPKAYLWKQNIFFTFWKYQAYNSNRTKNFRDFASNTQVVPTQTKFVIFIQTHFIMNTAKPSTIVQSFSTQSARSTSDHARILRI